MIILTSLQKSKNEPNQTQFSSKKEKSIVSIVAISVYEISPTCYIKKKFRKKILCMYIYIYKTYV